MKSQLITNEVLKIEKLHYQIPMIVELQANEFTQSASSIMRETDGGYYS
jgi:hypothetical protein